MVINGKEVTWNEISREQLMYLIIDKELSNASIAKAFGVSMYKVRYKKSKFKLTVADRLWEEFARGNGELIDALNEDVKSWFLDYKNVDTLSKSIANYIFRSGPIENLHGNSQLVSDKSMKAINIYMINRIAGLLTYALNGNWLKLRLLTDYFNMGTTQWYPAEPELDEIEKVF